MEKEQEKVIRFLAEHIRKVETSEEKRKEYYCISEESRKKKRARAKNRTTLKRKVEEG